MKNQELHNKLFPKEKALLLSEIRNLDFSEDLNRKDTEAFTACCYRMVLMKSETFCIEGEQCDIVAFLVSGHLYSSYKVKDIEYVTRLFLPPQFRIVSDFVSSLRGGVASCTIKSVDKSILICMSIHDLDALYFTHPHLIKIERMLIVKNDIANSQAMEFIRRHNNTERIRAFLKLYPEAFKYFTKTVIGSFLGVDRREVSKIYVSS